MGKLIDENSSLEDINGDKVKRGPYKKTSRQMVRGLPIVENGKILPEAEEILTKIMEGRANGLFNVEMCANLEIPLNRIIAIVDRGKQYYHCSTSSQLMAKFLHEGRISYFD